METEGRCEKFLKISEVVVTAGISRSLIYSLIKAGKFPEPIRIGTKCKRWRESEILSWMAEQRPGEAPVRARGESGKFLPKDTQPAPVDDPKGNQAGGMRRNRLPGAPWPNKTLRQDEVTT